jgi:hypothetical protein
VSFTLRPHFSSEKNLLYLLREWLGLNSPAERGGKLNISVPSGNRKTVFHPTANRLTKSPIFVEKYSSSQTFNNMSVFFYFEFGLQCFANVCDFCHSFPLFAQDVTPVSGFCICFARHSSLFIDFNHLNLSPCLNMRFGDFQFVAYAYSQTIRHHGTKATGWTIRSSNPVRNRRFFSPPRPPNRLRGLHSFLFSGHLGSFPEVERLGREVYHLPPPSAEVKNERSYTSTLPICLTGGGQEKLQLFPLPSIMGV